MSRDICVEVCTTVQRHGEDVELVVQGSFPTSSLPDVIDGPQSIRALTGEVAMGNVHLDVATALGQPRPLWQDDFTGDEDEEVRVAIVEAALETLRGGR